MSLLGWTTWGVGLMSLTLLAKGKRKHILAVYLSLGILGAMDISTDLVISNFLQMTFGLTLAAGLPYVLTRRYFNDRTLIYSWKLRRWTKTQVWYFIGIFAGAYFVLPAYFRTSEAYLNWSVEPTFLSVLLLFLGTQAVGLWDELFFVNSTLPLLRKQLSFRWANIVQAILFTSFLYELGFTGWGPVIVFPFALSQGVILQKTKSLSFIVALHLSIDLLLFFILVNLHTGWFDIFI